MTLPNEVTAWGCACIWRQVIQRNCRFSFWRDLTEKDLPNLLSVEFSYTILDSSHNLKWFMWICCLGVVSLRALYHPCFIARKLFQFSDAVCKITLSKDGGLGPFDIIKCMLENLSETSAAKDLVRSNNSFWKE